MKRKKKVVVVVMVVVTVASLISQVGPATPHLREAALTDKRYSPAVRAIRQVTRRIHPHLGLSEGLLNGVGL